jgi:pilus assembly protein CpaF
METLVMMAGYDIPVRAIREQVAGAIDLIVQTARMRDGSRKITSVSEIVGMEGEVVTTQEIIKYEQHGMDKQDNVAGSFVYTGVQPNFMKKLEEYGISFDIAGLNSMTLTTSAW